MPGYPASFLKIFVSARAGIVVMAVVAILSLAGVIVPQGQAQEFYLDAYGRGFGNLLLWLRLDDVFHSSLYTFWLVLLCLMVVACSFRRLPHTIRSARWKIFKLDPHELNCLPFSASLVVGVDREEAVLHLIDICRRRLYRTARKDRNGLTALTASKGEFSRYGTFLLHLSFVFLLAGGILFTRFGTRQDIALHTGEEFYLDQDKETIVRVDDFNIEYDQRGNVSDYLCHVSVTRNDQLILEKNIRPNHPLKFEGKEVYLSSYEDDFSHPLGAVVTIYKTPDTLVVPHIYLEFGKEALIGEIDAIAKLVDATRPYLRLEFEDGTVEVVWLDDRGFTHSGQYRAEVIHEVPSTIVWLEVVYEPAQYIVVTGLVLLSVGGFLCLYLSHRQIWFIVQPEGSDKAIVVFGGRTTRNPEGFKDEFEKIRSTIGELS